MNHTSLQTNNALKSMAAMTTGFLSGLVRAQPSNTALSRLNHFAESPRTLHPLQTIHELPGGSKTSQPSTARLRPSGGPTSPSPSPTLNGKPAGPTAQLLWREKRPSNEAAGPSNGAGPKEEKACSSRSLLAPPPPPPPPQAPPQSSAIDGADGSPGHRIVRTGEEKRKLLAQDTVSTSSCPSSASSSFDDDDGPWKIRLVSLHEGRFRRNFINFENFALFEI